MLTLEQQKLKAELTGVIQNWINRRSESLEWESGFGEYVGDYFAERMADAAFTVLLAVRDIQIWLNENNT